MAVYVPIQPSVLVAGLKGNAAAWTVLQGNSDACLEDYAPPIAISHVRWATTSTSYVIKGRFVLPRNVDNEDLRLRLWWSSNNTANVRMTVGADTASTSASPTAAGAVTTLTLPLTGSGHPRTGTVEIHGTAAAEVKVFAVELVLAPGALTTAETDAGNVQVGTHWTAADRAAPSEVVQRMLRNARTVARDRPAGFASTLLDAEGGQRDVDSTNFELSDRAMLPPTLDVRKLRCSVYLDAVGAGTPQALIQVGSWSATVTGVGWHHETPDLHLGRGAQAQVSVRRSAGTGAVYLVCHQWMREH